MQRISASRVTSMLALAATLAVAPSTQAQGVSYDITTTGTGVDPRGGGATTRTMMAGHGQLSNGISRLDFTQSMSPPGGMMGAGTYMISNTVKGTTTTVDPAKHQYMVVDLADLAKTSAALQQSMGGMMKTEITDVKVNVEDLGAGEPMEGYNTLKYRMTQSYTMKLTIMGHSSESKMQTTSDLWVAPQLDEIMNPGARPGSAPATGPMAALTAEITKAYAKVKKGVVLKSVHTSESGGDGKSRTTTVTMLISNVKRTAISPSVFEVPADYTKVASLSDALKPK